MRKKVLLIVMILAIVVVVVVVVSSLLHPSTRSQQNAVRSVSNNFVTAMLANKASTAYKLFSTQTQNDETSDDWASRVSQLSSFFAGSSAGYKDNTIKGSSATVEYLIVGQDGLYTISVQLTNQSNQWRVQSFSSRLN